MINPNQRNAITKAVERLQEAVKLYDKKYVYSAKQAIKDALELLEKLLDEKASIDALYGASSDKEAKELNCVIPKQPDTAGLF